MFNLKPKPFKTEISKAFRQISYFYIRDPVDLFGLDEMLKVLDGYKRDVNKKSYFKGCDKM